MREHGLHDREHRRDSCAYDGPKPLLDGAFSSPYHDVNHHQRTECHGGCDDSDDHDTSVNHDEHRHQHLYDDEYHQHHDNHNFNDDDH